MPRSYAIVVTRYGAKHWADSTWFPGTNNPLDRHYTLCMGTSSWTIESWRRTPDHPLGLTADDMEKLPICTRCEEMKAILTSNNGG